METTLLFRGTTDSGDKIELIMEENDTITSYQIKKNGVVVKELYNTTIAARDFISHFDPVEQQ